MLIGLLIGRILANSNLAHLRAACNGPSEAAQTGQGAGGVQSLAAAQTRSRKRRGGPDPRTASLLEGKFPYQSFLNDPSLQFRRLAVFVDLPKDHLAAGGLQNTGH